MKSSTYCAQDGTAQYEAMIPALRLHPATRHLYLLFRNFSWLVGFSELEGALMKTFGIVMLLVLGLTFSACGGSNNPGTINGNWSASLTGSQTLAFTLSLTQTGSNGLSVTNFQFNSNSPCFATPTTETGSFGVGGNFNGNVTGSFGLNISTESPADVNALTLQGNVNGNTITGTWGLTGATAGCTGSGSFTITKM